jgi:BirA family biotin operon repressor/biotin-[acetyl-CoA-carboxylase] ligase
MSLPEILRIERLGEVASTQDIVRDRLSGAGDVHGLVVRARAQTSGRGRQERAWASGRGGSYQTLAVRDDGGALRTGLVPIAIAVGIAETLAGKGVLIGLKWPNDLFLPEPARQTKGLTGKLGGILCEHFRGHLLVGVGVNVRNVAPDNGAALSSHDPDKVSDLVLEGIRRGLDELLADPGLPDRFARYDVLRGRVVRVREGGRELSGVAYGLDESGCLRLRLHSGVQSTCSGRIMEIDAAAV